MKSPHILSLLLFSTLCLTGTSAHACTEKTAADLLVQFVNEQAGDGEKLEIQNSGATLGKDYDDNVIYSVAVTANSSKDGQVAVFATLQEDCKKFASGPYAVKLK